MEENDESGQIKQDMEERNIYELVLEGMKLRKQLLELKIKYKRIEKKLSKNRSEMLKYHLKWRETKKR